METEVPNTNTMFRASLSPCPHKACFSPSHQEGTFAIGDATTLMGGQVRRDLEKGASMGRGSFLLESEAGRELLVSGRLSLQLFRREQTVSGMCLKCANSKSFLFPLS